MILIPFLILILSLLGVGLYMGTYIVPQQQVWIVQRLGKFNRRLTPGANWIVPFIDTVAY
jgi:regulator of protease activity HflC (stomatin/prohibitin superfamily)